MVIHRATYAQIKKKKEKKKKFLLELLWFPVDLRNKAHSSHLARQKVGNKIVMQFHHTTLLR